MADAVGLMMNIKRAALEALEASKPVQVLSGTVVSAKPLKIQIDQKMTLGGDLLTLTRNVTDFKTEMTGPEGRRSITIHNGLRAGEQVVLFRKQKGHKYIVIDREGK